jgi:type VI secretion system FHA domain protein
VQDAAVALRLTVISDQAPALGERASVLLGARGGTIGRAHDNDLVLPDSNRYISAHHARIHYRNGGYVIEDTSTNGVFLNGAREPVGKLGPQPLRGGDLLRLGTYQLRVIDDASNTADLSAIVAFSSADGHTASIEGEDIAEDLLLEDLLVDDPSVTAERRALDPWGQKINDSGVLRFDKAQRTGTGMRRAAPVVATGRAQAATPGLMRSPPPPPAPRPGGLETFCRGAGLDLRLLPASSQERMLRLAGLLMREALVGIKELSRVQRTMRSAAGLLASNEDPDRLALQNLPVEELLVKLLAEPGDNHIDALQWLRELFAVASRHDAALMNALRPALEEFTQRLDPALHDSAEGAAERFKNLTESPEGRLPRLFVEALARRFDADFSGKRSD